MDIVDIYVLTTNMGSCTSKQDYERERKKDFHKILNCLIHEFVDHYCEFGKNTYVDNVDICSAFQHYLSDVKQIVKSYNIGVGLTQDFLDVFMSLEKDIKYTGKLMGNGVFHGVHLKCFPRKDDFIDDSKLRVIKDCYGNVHIKQCIN